MDAVLASGCGIEVTRMRSAVLGTDVSIVCEEVRDVRLSTNFVRASEGRRAARGEILSE